MTASPPTGPATIIYLEAAISGVFVREEPEEILRLAAAPGDLGAGGVQLIRLSAWDDGTDVLVAPSRIACVLKSNRPTAAGARLAAAGRLQ